MFTILGIAEQYALINHVMGNVFLNKREQNALSDLVCRYEPSYFKKVLLFFKKSKEILPQRDDLTFKILDPHFPLCLMDKIDFINSLSSYNMYVLLEYDYIANEVFDLVIIPLVKKTKNQAYVDQVLQNIMINFNLSVRNLPDKSYLSLKRCFLELTERFMKMCCYEAQEEQNSSFVWCSFYSKEEKNLLLC